MKTRNVLWLAAVAASSALSALPAAAQWYLGAGIGQGDADGAKDKETAWTARLGYMFTPYVGVEAAYYDLGKYKFEDQVFGTTVRGSTEAQAWGGALVGVLPINPMFQAYGRLGYAHNKMDAKLDVADERFKERDTENGAYWGIGARYMFNRQVGAFAEYTKHEKIDVQSWMLGIHFAF
jgi:hypothetical protein